MQKLISIIGISALCSCSDNAPCLAAAARTLFHVLTPYACKRSHQASWASFQRCGRGSTPPRSRSPSATCTNSTSYTATSSLKMCERRKPPGLTFARPLLLLVSLLRQPRLGRKEPSAVSALPKKLLCFCCPLRHAPFSLLPLSLPSHPEDFVLVLGLGAPRRPRTRAAH